MSEHRHDHHAPMDAHEPHAAMSGRRFLVSILITSLVLAAELAGGILTHSLALLSDAAHVFLDIFALALGYGAIQLSRRSATGRHSYGFFRMKVLAAFINGATLLIVSFEILKEAVVRFMQPREVIAGPMLIVAAIGLAANLLVALVLRGHDHEDLNARAAFLHVLGDALSSVGVIIAGFVILFLGWHWVDPLVSVLIAVVILRGAFRVLREAVHILNEGSPQNAQSEDVSAAMSGIPGVRGVHDVHVWSLEPGYRILTAHVVLENQELSATHAIMERIKTVLDEEFSIEHTTIQFECEDCGQCGPVLQA